MLMGFLVSWSQSFLASWFQISKFQIFTKCSSHIFWNRLTPYPRLSRSVKTDLHDGSVPTFPPKMDLQSSEIYKANISTTMDWFSSNYLGDTGVSKDR